ncbi:MAG: hypothetical protein CVU05_14525 [Bacteroidetes bacterium HGW-Bacteroidetes-21]|nr:MAG: hypothetical protein CVU05_14525 [Bacteroidetes bacterium HGW-Bacteroidetes-21]
MLAWTTAWFLYRNDNSLKDAPRNIRRMLFGLRLVLVFVVSFFLLQPFVRLFYKQIEKPVLIFAQDNSSSILLSNRSNYYKKEYRDNVRDFLNEFDEVANVRYYSFGDSILADTLSAYNQSVSNYSAFLEYVRNTYVNRHVGAMIIAGDGIYNRGFNPAENDPGLWFPVYTVAMGDSSVRKDLLIKELIYNKVTYVGNRFALKSWITAGKCKGETFRLAVTSEGKTLYTKDIQITSSDWVQEINMDLPADKPGIHRFTISLNGIEQEVNYKNNSRDFYVEVLESRRKILVLFQAPHPDLGAIKQALEPAGQFEMELLNAHDFNGSTESYDLVILHQIPSKDFNATTLMQQLAKQEKPMWFILGNNSNIQSFNTLNSGVKIAQNSGIYDESSPSLSENFSLFQLSDEFPEFLKQMPPLVCPYGDYTVLFPANTMIYQRIKNIRTNRPLMQFSEMNGTSKCAITSGEGIWRWRIKCSQQYNNFDLFNEFVSRTVQYLTSGNKKERFIVTAARSFDENESVVFGAELYDKSYQPDNRYDVLMELTDSAGKKFDYVFSKQGEFYRLNCGALPTGHWKYKAFTKAGNETFTRTGAFSVVPSIMEDNDLTARFEVLEKLAIQNSGKMVADTSFNELKQFLQNNPSMKPESRAEYDMYDLIEIRILLFILLLFASLEWFFRKFYGSY